ncbi:hypothetical protein GEMRC1_012306 [Eukaryota sp. GEM-RC1]
MHEFDIPELDTHFPKEKNPFNPAKRAALTSAFEKSTPVLSTSQTRPKTAHARTSSSSSSVDDRITHLHSSDRRTTRLLSFLQSSSSSAPSVNELLSTVRSQGRLNMINKLTIDDINAVVASKDREIEHLRSDFSVEVAELSSTNSSLQEEIARLKEEVVDKELTIDNLSTKIDLLSTKARFFEQKCVEKDQKLTLFSDLQPVFETLSQTFSFTTPSELVEKYDTLQELQRQHLEMLDVANEDKSRLQETVNQLTGTNELLRHKLSNLETVKQSRLEMETERLKSQIRNYEELIKRHDQEVVRSRRLELSLQELHDKWINKDDTLSTEFRPNHIVTAIDMLLTTQGVSDSKDLYFRKLTGLSHRFWREHLSDEEELKGQPLKVYERVFEFVLQLKVKNSNLFKKVGGV